MFAMTAAHKTLPIPSYARIRNMENGRSVVVRLNDRGPFRAGRIVDLSYAAAVRLGIDKVGSAEVELVALSASGEKPEKIAELLSTDLSVDVMFGAQQADSGVASSDAVYFQAGSFSQQDNALNLRLKLLSTGLMPVEVIDVQVGDRVWYRVRVGPVPSVVEQFTLEKLQGLGLELTKFKL